jgi:sugar (pentulose or hexulose) kinase
MQGLQEEFALRWPALRDVPFLPAVGDGACGNVGSGCVTPERFAINFGTSGAIRAMWREESGQGSVSSGQKKEPHAKAQSHEEESSGQSSVVGDQKERAESTPSSSGRTVSDAVAPQAGTSVPDTASGGTGRPSSPDDASTPPGLWRYRANGERPVMGAAFSDAGNAYAWLNRTLKLPPEEELEGYLLAMEPAAHGLTVLPFLAGERSMGWNPDARAVFAGLTLDTSPIEITQAVLESIALRFALAAERLRSVFGREQEIVVSGGAFRESRILPQIFADVLGCPITLAEEPEASSRGAALLAMEAVGMIASVESVEAHRGHTIAPNPAHQDLYQAMLARQQEQYVRNFPESV